MKFYDVSPYNVIKWRNCFNFNISIITGQMQKQGVAVVLKRGFKPRTHLLEWDALLRAEWNLRVTSWRSELKINAKNLLSLLTKQFCLWETRSFDREVDLPRSCTFWVVVAPFSKNLRPRWPPSDSKCLRFLPRRFLKMKLRRIWLKGLILLGSSYCLVDEIDA